MAEEFIDEIYRKSNTIYELERCAEYLITNNLGEFGKIWTANADILLSMVNDFASFDATSANTLSALINGVLNNNKDMVLVSELLENGILPLLYQYMSNYGGIDVVDGKWELKSSKSGYLTLYDTEKKRHLHSLKNPMWEAKRKVEAIYKGQYDTVLIMGGGLGYLAKAVWELSQGSVDIFVFENEPCILEYGKLYGVVGDIPEDKLHYIVDTNTDELYYKFTEYSINATAPVYIISDWMIDIYSGVIKDQLEGISLNSWAFVGFSKLYDINFWRNKRRFTGDIDDLKNRNMGNTFIVVAAGPSLDSCIGYLKESIGSKVIVAVNTVIKRLLKEGIRPDYVCLVDPTKGVYEHLDGVQNELTDIPLIAESCAYWKFVDIYMGPVIRIFGPMYSVAVEEAKRLEQTVYPLGTTVTNLAIEASVILGAESVELVGADLSFPGDIYYAGSTKKRVTSRYQDDIFVKSVDGNMVRTVNTFDIFRKSVESQILRNPNVEYVNLSEHGALISGTVSGGWKDYSLGKIADIKNISNDNRLVLNRILGILPDVLNSLKNYRSSLVNMRFTSDMDERESKEIIATLNQWYNYASECGNVEAKIYLDTIKMSISSDEVYVTDLRNDTGDEFGGYKNTYFWYCQIVGKITSGIIKKNPAIDELLKKMQSNIVKELSDSMPQHLMNGIENAKSRNNTVYILTDHISSGEVTDCKAVEYAALNVKKGSNVLLINSSELYPVDIRVPFFGEIERDNCDDKFEIEAWEYNGVRIPYFQCENYMPDAETIMVLLSNIQNVKPSKIVSFTDNSPLVWMIEKITSVEHRTSEER